MGIEPITTAWKAGAIPFCNTRESGWPDLNRRPLRPKRSALPSALHPVLGPQYTAFALFRQGQSGQSHFTSSLGRDRQIPTPRGKTGHGVHESR